MLQGRSVDFLALFVAMICLMMIMTGIVDCSCPPNLKQFATGICGIYFLKGEHHLCDAGAMCASYGKQHGQHLFVVGKDYTHFIKTEILWTSISDPFSKANRGKAGWIDGDPRTPTFQSKWDSFHWQYMEPVYYPCVFWPPNTRGLRSYSVHCSYTISVACQFAFMLPKARWAVEFKQNFPAFINGSLFSPSTTFNLCTRKITNVHSLMGCAFRCAQVSECRSAYYNAEHTTCLLTLYIDSGIPTSLQGYSGTWKRVAKTGRQNTFEG